MLYALNILVAALIVVHSTIVWRRLGFRYLSPAGSAAMLWALIWAVHLADLFRFFEVSATAQIMSLVPVVFMYGGELLALSMRGSRAPRAYDDARFLRYMSVNGWIGLFFAVVALVSVILLFGNPLDDDVGAQIKAARTTIGVSMLAGSPLYAFAQYAVVGRSFLYLALLMLPAIWMRDRKRALRIGSIAAVTAVVNDIAWGSRVTMLDVAIFVFAAAAIAPRPRTGTRVRRGRLWMVAMIVSAFLVFGVVADNITKSTRPDRRASIGQVEVPYSIYQLLLYYTQSLVTFDQTLPYTDYRTSGLMSGAGLLNAMYLFRIYRNDDLPIYEIMYDWELDNPSFRNENDFDRGNIYSWLRYMYADFGLAGLAIVPLALGFLAGRSARTLADRGTASLLAVAAITLAYYSSLRSPLILGIRQDPIVLALIFIAAIHFLSRKPALRRRPAVPARTAVDG